ncbi:MAG: hypothetical protein UW35_C0021G0004 [Candidatus Collierbacteria bacterium GW2011_GWF2_44_15]|uniref:Uncharacterized protein n=2 Tax=Candidatus Collieribacteriota TaxID=1752725 RepID=A0A0G1KEA2_9BACT|nr:MAG: hypothetical protein UW23_C0027G0019 [Candidatus Collierbacteria bacterium GW2011_GWA1_44_12]KKT46139.1 MAG: hypothetical protein UW35_C0021G0004 [Candidatus Collierbacteria bacterium GW2011_GWF2_44_15]
MCLTCLEHKPKPLANKPKRVAKKAAKKSK